MKNSKINCPGVANTANQLFKDISKLIETTQQQTLRKISQTGVLLYWHIGQRVNEERLHNAIKKARERYESQKPLK
jgi:hypothetical protein